MAESAIMKIINIKSYIEIYKRDYLYRKNNLYTNSFIYIVISEEQ